MGKLNFHGYQRLMFAETGEEQEERSGDERKDRESLERRLRCSRTAAR